MKDLFIVHPYVFFFVFAVLGIFLLLIARKTSKSRMTINKIVGAFFYILYIIDSLIVGGGFMEIIAHFSSKESLEQGTKFVSGHSMNGYEFWFGIGFCVYLFFSHYIYSKITGTTFLDDK